MPLRSYIHGWFDDLLARKLLVKAVIVYREQNLGLCNFANTDLNLLKLY